jgi:hypothetical protein
VACTFLRTVKKRGPPKGYVNTLEQRLASLENIVTELRAGVMSVGGDVAEEPSSSSSSTGYSNKRQAREEDVEAAKGHQKLVSSRPLRPQDGTTERSTVLGYLSIDENLTMRYHGPTSGLYLITSSRVFSSPFWQFSNPGFWPRSKRTTFRTEDEIVSAADAVAGGILPGLAVQNKLLEYVYFFSLSQLNFSLHDVSYSAYWTYIHAYFPVIHKETFLFQLSKDRRRIPRSGRSALDQLERRIPQVLLLSMFALSARFVERHDQQEDSDPGDTYATRAEALIAQHSKLI